MSNQLELIDKDGENLAVRAFLLFYASSQGNVSVRDMTKHLSNSGFYGCWPDWVTNENYMEHLTKTGAQNWLRHLFAIECDSVKDELKQITKNKLF